MASTYDRDQKQLCQNHVCIICGREAQLIYDHDAGSHVARCNIKGHQGLIRRGDPVLARIEGLAGTDEQKADAVTDYLSQEKLRKMKRRGDFNMGNEQRTTALELYRQMPATVYDKEVARAALEVAYPKAPASIRAVAAGVCVDYKLHPLANHIYLVDYAGKWSVLWGIDAYRLLASRRGPVDYPDDSPRIMTEDEQMRFNGEIDNSKLWAICKVACRKTGTATHGIGSYDKSQTPLGVDKGNSRGNMAKIRAEKAALKRLRPNELPAIEQFDVVDDRFVIEGEYNEVNQSPQLTEQANSDFATGSASEEVDQETGEITPMSDPDPNDAAPNEGITGEPETVEAMVPEAQEAAPSQPRSRKARPEQSVTETHTDNQPESSPASSGGIQEGEPTLKEEPVTRGQKLTSIAAYCSAQGARSIMAMAVFCGGEADTRSLKDLSERQIDYGYDKMLFEQLESETAKGKEAS